MKQFYVYMVTFTDEYFYIGYRGTKGLPEDDFLVKYFSSSKIVKQKIRDGTPYTGQVLCVFDCKETAYSYEQKLIREHFSNSKILNQRCYDNREGYGILTECALAKISEKSKAMWADPAYRARLSEAHKARWANNPSLKEKQSLRLTGKKRPEHAEKLKGRTVSEEQKQKLRKPKTAEHNAKVSAALKGQPKSAEHKQKLSKAMKGKRRPTQKIAYVTDHHGTVFESPSRLSQHYGLSTNLFTNLDQPIRHSSVYQKLNIPYTNENRSKTKRELGFIFLSEAKNC